MLTPIQTIQGKIIIINLMRDAVRNVSPKIFQRIENEETKMTFNRRDLVFESLLDALEDLEEGLEDLEDLEEENKGE